jgi:hypothetical protein
MFTPGVRGPAPIVDGLFGVLNRQAVRLADGQNATVLDDFTIPRPGTRRLWVPARVDGEVQSFSHAQLAAGTDAPGIAITGAGDLPINAIFDNRGNMWVATFADSMVLK